MNQLALKLEVGPVRHRDTQGEQLQLFSAAQRQASLLATFAGRDPDQPVRVFAYGSLLWNPGFAPASQVRARVHGWHRSLNVHALAHRGSITRPGLWFGLAPGGCIGGMVLEVAQHEREAVLQALWRREMPDDGYTPRWVSCRLADGSQVEALAFTANRRSRLYAGKLQLPEIARRMHDAAGPRGRARCYLLRTRAALAALGLKDRWLDAVTRELLQRYGQCENRECGSAAALIAFQRRHPASG